MFNNNKFALNEKSNNMNMSYKKFIHKQIGHTLKLNRLSTTLIFFNQLKRFATNFYQNINKVLRVLFV